jgi:hypothetical protein
MQCTKLPASTGIGNRLAGSGYRSCEHLSYSDLRHVARLTIIISRGG